MEFSTEVPGLFHTLGETQLDVADWGRMLLYSNFPSRCVLERLTFCKATKGKQHEFIVLYFRHWNASVPATARLVVDRAPNPSPKGNGSFIPMMYLSDITSSSALRTSAFDSVLITPNTVHWETYLRTIYGPYKELCTLTFSAPTSKSVCPSASQISVLLFVISRHAPNYHLCKFQCYWFASTIWETIKQLFPGYTETAWNRGRSRCHGVKVDKADSVEVVCKKYTDEWTRFENEAEHTRTQQIL
ncbi:hypothetical protein BDR03DRAFT_290115 [Suillus americanus]|nr:hypothetical protein BDR03DRAFT_290115 [Suillus americanus]